MLEQRGVYGDIVVGDIPVDWVPYDTDILSLEREYVFRVSTSGPFVCCTSAGLLPLRIACAWWLRHAGRRATHWIALNPKS